MKQKKNRSAIAMLISNSEKDLSNLVRALSSLDQYLSKAETIAPGGFG